MFKYTLDNKRYHTLNYYYKTKYGKKTFKVALNGGFSCPNKEKTGHGCQKENIRYIEKIAKAIFCLANHIPAPPGKIILFSPS